MKKNYYYIVFGLGVATFIGTAIYLFINERKNKKTKCNSKFLFVGDSNTAAFYSYADVLKNFCPDAKVVKIAEVGKGTGWMLENFENHLKEGGKYDVITIFGGSNDLGNHNQQKTYENLNKMYDLAKSNGAVLVAVTPPNKNFVWGENRTCNPNSEYCKYLPQNIERLKNLINFIKTNKKPNYVLDYYKITSYEPNLSSDKVHGTPTAHNLLFNEFKNKVLSA